MASEYRFTDNGKSIYWHVDEAHEEELERRRNLRAEGFVHIDDVKALLENFTKQGDK